MTEVAMRRSVWMLVLWLAGCAAASSAVDAGIDSSTDAGTDTASDAWRLPDSLRERCVTGMYEQRCFGCSIGGCCVRDCAPDGYYGDCEVVGHPCVDAGADSGVDGGPSTLFVYTCPTGFGPSPAHSLDRACAVDADCTTVSFACSAAVFGARGVSAAAFGAFAALCGCMPSPGGWVADDGTIGTTPSAARVACVGGVCTSMFGP